MIQTLRQTLSKHQVEILKAVLYFDVFNYPLRRDELYENSATELKKEDFNIELHRLLADGLLKEEEGFILNTTTPKHSVSKRVLGNKGALEVMPLAYSYSRKIASFPFVEGVCLSGGLSKNYYDETSDIDFFIITRPGRLWLCRTMLILRYKLLPPHKRKYWCTNYFISSDDLKLPDVNSFTATELAFLIPTINYSLYLKLLEENKWYKHNFPVKPLAAPDKCTNAPSVFLKSFVENLLGGKIGSWLDTHLLNFTLRHWQKKYPELSSSDFELQFRSQKNVCKRHTKGFQNKVLHLWMEKQKDFEAAFKVSLQ